MEGGVVGHGGWWMYIYMYIWKDSAIVVAQGKYGTREV
jgi:hypothetical protein